ncbi:MAG: hypothetical protein PHQ86_09470, partial [Dehalococcoidales bacterium]|nr:hypothetical protein [Dehalococcoidales bacterium]
DLVSLGGASGDSRTSGIELVKDGENVIVRMDSDAVYGMLTFSNGSPVFTQGQFKVVTNDGTTLNVAGYDISDGTKVSIDKGNISILNQGGRVQRKTTYADYAGALGYDGKLDDETIADTTIIFNYRGEENKEKVLITTVSVTDIKGIDITESIIRLNIRIMSKKTDVITDDARNAMKIGIGPYTQEEAIILNAIFTYNNLNMDNRGIFINKDGLFVDTKGNAITITPFKINIEGRGYTINVNKGKLSEASEKLNTTINITKLNYLTEGAVEVMTIRLRKGEGDKDFNPQEAIILNAISTYSNLNMDNRGIFINKDGLFVDTKGVPIAAKNFTTKIEGYNYSISINEGKISEGSGLLNTTINITRLNYLTKGAVLIFVQRLSSGRGTSKEFNPQETRIYNAISTYSNLNMDNRGIFINKDGLFVDTKGIAIVTKTFDSNFEGENISIVIENGNIVSHQFIHRDNKLILLSLQGKWKNKGDKQEGVFSDGKGTEIRFYIIKTGNEERTVLADLYDSYEAQNEVESYAYSYLDAGGGVLVTRMKKENYSPAMSFDEFAGGAIAWGRVRGKIIYKYVVSSDGKVEGQPNVTNVQFRDGSSAKKVGDQIITNNVYDELSEAGVIDTISAGTSGLVFAKGQNGEITVVAGNGRKVTLNEAKIGSLKLIDVFNKLGKDIVTLGENSDFNEKTLQVFLYQIDIFSENDRLWFGDKYYSEYRKSWYSGDIRMPKGRGVFSDIPADLRPPLGADKDEATIRTEERIETFLTNYLAVPSENMSLEQTAAFIREANAISPEAVRAIENISDINRLESNQVKMQVGAYLLPVGFVFAAPEAVVITIGVSVSIGLGIQGITWITTGEAPRPEDVFANVVFDAGIGSLLHGGTVLFGRALGASKIARPFVA